MRSEATWAKLEPLMWHKAATKRCYLSGPMSGLPDNGAERFEAAAKRLRADGWEVLSPIELDEAEGKLGVETVPGSEEWRGFLARDLRVLMGEGIATVIVLPGWEHSRGARLEVHVARELGKEVLLYPTLKPVEHDPASRPSDSILEEAGRLVHGDRGEDYGHPADDFGRTAQIMGAILGTEVRPEQVPLLMIAVKISRLVQTADKRDSCVDLAGYAETYAMTLARQGRPLR